MLETKALSLCLQPFYSRTGGLEGASYVSTYGDRHDLAVTMVILCRTNVYSIIRTCSVLWYIHSFSPPSRLPRPLTHLASLSPSRHLLLLQLLVLGAALDSMQRLEIHIQYIPRQRRV